MSLMPSKKLFGLNKNRAIASSSEQHLSFTMPDSTTLDSVPYLEEVLGSSRRCLFIHIPIELK